MATELAPRHIPPQDIDGGDHMIHLGCPDCYPDPFASKAFCGALLSRQEDDDLLPDCVVCAAMDEHGCPECGA